MSVTHFIPQVGIRRVWVGFFAAICALFISGLLTSGCHNAPSGRDTRDALATSGLSSKSDSAHAAPFSLHHSKCFTVEVHPGYQLLSVFNASNTKPDTLRYLISPHKADIPAAYHGLPVIRTPVRRIAIFSTTNVGLLSFLESDSTIIGLSTPEFVSNPGIRARIERGEISGIGQSTAPNIEAIIGLNPDLVIVSAMPSAKLAPLELLQKAGIPVLVNSDWLENTPLGRAEWVKLFALLLGKEALAETKFREVETRYNALVSLTKNQKLRPSVFVGRPFKGEWNVPNGESYVACLLADAGAAYHWSFMKGTGSLNLNFEKVFPVALKADVWLNPGTAQTMPELLDVDARFRDFPAVKNAKVYNNNKILNPSGGNAYWEYGVANPQIILADLIWILHPELRETPLMKQHELTFYKQLK